jgi:phosphatidylserine/phosphatidylglycerophosphate/cardiolipin synthase-like enzyme
MHAKVAWNDQNTILLGSANLDPHSMAINFESCLEIKNQNLTWQLQRAFEADLHTCIPQTRDVFRRQSLPGKFVSHACNLASSWL